MSKTERILVIRYGALGDMIYCFQSYQEIRKAHPNAEITLLTAPAFVNFAKAMPWFDDVMIDTHPPKHRPDMWLAQACKIHKLKPTHVYELHGKLRQTILFWLLGGPFGPKWSGAARFCAYPRLWPPQPGTHFRDFLGSQLRLAGVPAQPPADLAWLDAPIDALNLPARYAVIIPGCTPGQNYKRWPVEHYAAVVKHLNDQGFPVIAVGTKADTDAITAISALAPTLIDLSDRTNLFQLAGVLRHSVLVIGNDTGPMHMAAALGTPTLALLSGSTDPVWSAPPEPKAQWLKQEPLKDLSLEKVFLAVAALLANNNG
jgi:ADP-heptose:LPS heptosyltransferase